MRDTVASTRRNFLTHSCGVGLLTCQVAPLPVSQGSILIGKSAGSFYRWVAGELQHYLRLLSGAELPIVTTADAPAGAVPILLGGPASNATSWWPPPSSGGKSISAT